MSAPPKVTRASLGKTFPIRHRRRMKLLPARVWTQQEWERIERGYQARDMDEKWDVFVENQVAFLHRSWTGRGVFEASFSQVQGGWRISSATTESPLIRRVILAGQRDVSAQRDRVLLELVLSATVLGEPAAGLRAELVRLFTRRDRPAPPEGLIEHHFLGRRSDPGG